MKRGSIKIERKRLKFIALRLMCLFTCLSATIPTTGKAQASREPEEAMEAQTAYLDMSTVGPLQLHFIEEEGEIQADYYYAAQAFHILKEKLTMDTMYENCCEVVVVVHYNDHTNEVMRTTTEPQVQTGYLNLLSKETNKYYTIDQIKIHIQRY